LFLIKTTSSRLRAFLGQSSSRCIRFGTYMLYLRIMFAVGFSALAFAFCVRRAVLYESRLNKRRRPSQRHARQTSAPMTPCTTHFVVRRGGRRRVAHVRETLNVRWFARDCGPAAFALTAQLVREHVRVGLRSGSPSFGEPGGGPRVRITIRRSSSPI